MIVAKVDIQNQITAKQTARNTLLVNKFLPDILARVLDSINKIETEISNEIQAAFVTNGLGGLTYTGRKLSLQDQITRSIEGFSTSETEYLSTVVMDELTTNHPQFLVDYAAYNIKNSIIAAGYTCVGYGNGLDISLS